MIVLPMAFVTESTAHPGLITLIPVLGAVLVIAAEPDALFNRTLLCWRPMTFVGLISYSLYLWHWPLLAYLFIAVPDATPSVLIAALATLIWRSTICALSGLVNASMSTSA